MRQKLLVEGRIREKPLTRKETHATVGVVRGIDGKNEEWRDIHEKRLSGEHIPGIIAQSEGAFSLLMCKTGTAMYASRFIFESIIKRNRNCKGFTVSPHITSLEVNGKFFSADILAYPSSNKQSAFELRYTESHFNKVVVAKREPLTEANLWQRLTDLGLALANYNPHRPMP
ncbi:MAG: hypothetical protein WCT52_05995 [Candidatus Micrarchaeia archaeon]